MRAGDLRHQVELQSASTVKNAYGEELKTWTTYATVWAAIEPLRGDERYQAQQLNADLTTKVRIRYRSDVQPTHRVKFGDRILEISSIINPKERNEQLELLCKELV